ncbi:MAG: NERD domain-containing protein [Porticoccaceae bacterium]|jgi:hypothetical protein|nr:NERD domain-containing protein [Porticoccaceae bacterium]
MNFLILELTYLGLFVGMFVVWIWFRDRRPVKLPFTEDFRNQPGKSLLNELDDLKLDAFGLLITAFLLPFIATAIFSQLSDLENRNSLVVVCGVVAWLIMVGAFFKKTRIIRNYKLGYLGEVYVAQCLMPLVAKHYRLFHDYPCRDFNIDHVVIGPEGIFAVETKARRKRDRKGGSNDVKVRVQGDVLHFPDWTDEESIPQAKRQAKWLEKEMIKEFAEPYQVVPVLVIPGWYIDTSAGSSILVCNGREMEKIIPKWGKEKLSRDRLPKLVGFFRRRCSYRPDQETTKAK